MTAWEESRKWDKRVTRSSGVITTTWTHRETRQTMTTEEALPTGDARPPQPALTIDTWVNCKIGQAPPRASEFHTKTRVNGQEHKLVAHINTGNLANTVMSARVFDTFFPLIQAPGD